MFRRAPRRHRRSVPLAFQPLEPRLAMAGDFSYAFDGNAYGIKPDEVKYVDVATFAKGPAIDSIGEFSKSPFLDAAGKQVAHLVNLHDRMRDMEAVKQAEQAGISHDIERESKLVDPATGDPIDVQRGGATGIDSGLGGRGGVDPRSVAKDNTSRLTDPLTGQPLLGGHGGGSAGPSREDALAAGMAGKARAMDDVGKKKNSSLFAEGTITFEEAHVIGEFSYKTDDGTQISIFPGHDHYGDRIVAVLVERPDGTGQITWYGEVPEKPRPDDDSSTPPRKLTDAEKEAIRKELQGSFGPAGTPRPDDEGSGAGGSNGTGELLTYLDLAGQPRPDDDGHRGGVAPNGPVLNDLGLAGQPVDDDTNFGVIGPRLGGHLAPNPPFRN